jgi:hypothetical protein
MFRTCGCWRLGYLKSILGLLLLLLLGVAGSAPTEHVPQIMHVVATHLTKLDNDRISDEKLSRTRNMLKHSVWTQLGIAPSLRT